MRFRVVIGLLAALLVSYSIVWFVTAHNARKTIAAWIKSQQDAGHKITYSSLNLGGFPYRIEVRVMDLLVKGREGAMDWSLSSPHFVAVALLWNRDHQVLFADHLTLAMNAPEQPTESLVADDFRASYVTDQNEDPARISLTAKTLTMAGHDPAPISDGAAAPMSDGATAPGLIVPDIQGIKFKDMQFHWRSAAEAVREKGEAEDSDVQEPLAWQVAFMSKGVHYPGFEDGPYGADIQNLSLVFEMRGAGMGPRATATSIAAWRDHGGTLELTSGDIKWGKLEADITGSITLDQDFRPLGAFATLLKGYEPLLDHLLKNGGIEHQEAKTVKSTLDKIIASDTDNDGRLRIPLTLQSGRLLLGPLPIAILDPVVAR